jgi:hypothetical protein
VKATIAAVVLALIGWTHAPSGSEAGPLAQAVADVAHAAHVAVDALPEQAEPPTLSPLPEPVTVRAGRKVVHIPADCRRPGGSYDLVVHFHGDPRAVQTAFDNAGVKAVLVVLNLGIGSGPYEKAFAQEGSLDRLLESVNTIVSENCPMPERKLGRLALSSWSAGYGATYRILSHESEARRVDSVLLADGLHAGFESKYHSKVNALQMAPFDDFASRAVKGETLMAITHSSIVTPYASTTQTASQILETEGIERVPADEFGPRGMHLISRADRGGLSVRGFAGGDTDAHCDHLYALGENLLRRLTERWR